MDYELAKKLKDLGLGDGSFGYLDGTKIPIISGLTLGELIEACGDDFQDLCKGLNGRWSCVSFNHVFSKGETPLIAVANLYLALKK